jgi:hypothetical protein
MVQIANDLTGTLFIMMQSAFCDLLVNECNSNKGKKL